MDVFATYFKTIDWIIVMVYICIPVAIGVWVKKYVRQLSDFIVAGLYWKRASSTGAMIALFAGLLAILGIGPILFPDKPKPQEETK